MRQVCLLIFIFLYSINNLWANCLPISNFSDLASFSSFEADFNWVGAQKIQTPASLRVIDILRIEKTIGENAVSFISNTNFDRIDGGLYYDSFTMDKTGKIYDYYAYEAGDNGAGFIYEQNQINPVAYISDGIGGEIIGCIKM